MAEKGYGDDDGDFDQHGGDDHDHVVYGNAGN